jgi:hypothetical protein
MDQQQVSSSSQHITSSSSSRTKVIEISSILLITQRHVDMTIEQAELLKLLAESSQSSNKVVWYKNDGFNYTSNQGWPEASNFGGCRSFCEKRNVFSLAGLKKKFWFP